MAVSLYIKTGQGNKSATQKFSLYDADPVAECKRLLLADQALAVPSDSVYGLVMRYSPANARRLHLVRRRPESKPFLLAMAENVDFKVFIQPLTRSQQDFIDGHWPGKTTLVLPRAAGLEYPPGDTIALRQVDSNDNAFFGRVLKALGQPVLAPSLNLPGEPPLLQLEEIIATFGDQLAAIVHDDMYQPTEPSSIYDLTGEEPRRLR